jgi:carboxymethylenebutenolidase
MSHLDWTKALADIGTIKDHFVKEGNTVSIMGFCMGGALTFASLTSFSGFKNGGIFYGIPDQNAFKIEKITAKVIAHFGSEDPLKGFSDAETGRKVGEDAKKKKIAF